MSALLSRWLLAPLAMLLGAGCATWTADSGDRAHEALGTVPVVELDPQGCKDTEAAIYVPGVSYRPFEQAGPPWPEAPSVDAIIQKGELVVGVDDNTWPLSARDPSSNELKGFEIDLAESIADAIDPELPVRYRIVTTADKVTAAASGEVDLSISAITINCGRAKQVAFTLPYFQITQRYLVAGDSLIDAADDVRKVCITRGSSTSALAKDLETLVVDTRTECLAALQNGEVDAIYTHETFLWGFQMQDPNLRIVDAGADPTLYGIAVAPDRVDLVQFVNTLLADDAFRQQLQTSYAANFVTCSLCESDAPDELNIPTLPAEWLDLPPEGG